MDIESSKDSSNPDAKVVVITNLTRNVVDAHLQAVFSFYGEIVKIDLPLFGKCLSALSHPFLSPYSNARITLSWAK
jgi:hypothetical protein